MSNVVKGNVGINERIKGSSGFNGSKMERKRMINKKNGNRRIRGGNSGIGLFSFCEIWMLIRVCGEI